MNKKEYKINHRIKAEQVRVIGERGENFGIKPLSEAIAIAESKGLDLVEIAPEANPPVVKVIDYDKFRYQKEKEEKIKKQSKKSTELKHIRITPRSALNDLKIKADRAIKFLDNGHKVEINMFLRGREKRNKEFGLQKLRDFLNMFEDCEIVEEPKYSGRGYSVKIVKKKK